MLTRLRQYRDNHTVRRPASPPRPGPECCTRRMPSRSAAVPPSGETRAVWDSIAGNGVGV
jgi:hypothetical protein